MTAPSAMSPLAATVGQTSPADPAASRGGDFQPREQFAVADTGGRGKGERESEGPNSIIQRF